MESIWFDYWGTYIDVKYVNSIPRKGRYICTDLKTDVDYYDVDKDFLIGVMH